jgi:hypothetical protein
MFKVALLILLIDPSGHVVKSVDPIPGFKTLQECRDFVTNEVSKVSVPMGYKVKAVCVSADEVAT